MKSLTFVICLMLMVPQAYASRTVVDKLGLATIVIMDGSINRVSAVDAWRRDGRAALNLVGDCLYVVSHAFGKPIAIIDGVIYDKESDYCKGKYGKKYGYSDGMIRAIETRYDAISLRGSGFHEFKDATIYVLEGHRIQDRFDFF